MKYRFPVLFAVFAFGFAWSVAAAAERRPNMLFILADDLGYGDLACYGAPDIKTPNLDRLAKEGVRFTDFYANGPLCTPTRCAFMTARYPQRIGSLETAIPPGDKSIGLPKAEPTIANILLGKGYFTAMTGKWHLGYAEDCRPNIHGFVRFFGLLSGNHDHFTHRENNGQADLWFDHQPVAVEGYSPLLVTQRSIEFLDEAKGKPFFLYVAFNSPHFPLQGPEDASRPIAPKNWATGTRESYINMVEAMDDYVGQLLAALDERGLTTNTLVVFTSDNGGDRYGRNLPLAKGKGTLWEGGIRVPCIARWPGTLPAGVVSKQVGATFDWSATFVKLAGGKAPKHRPFDGLDLMPVLTGKQQVQKRTLFWRRVTPKYATTHRAVRDGDWKYIDEPNGREYLFNVTKDPSEATNLIAEQAELAAKMKQRIDFWEKDVSPPLYPPGEPATPRSGQ